MCVRRKAYFSRSLPSEFRSRKTAATATRDSRSATTEEQRSLLGTWCHPPMEVTCETPGSKKTKLLWHKGDMPASLEVNSLYDPNSGPKQPPQASASRLLWCWRESSGETKVWDLRRGTICWSWNSILWLPSGELTKSYGLWKSPCFIGKLSIAILVYWRVRLSVPFGNQTWHAGKSL